MQTDQVAAQQGQMELLQVDPGQVLPLDVAKAMRRLFDRRWRPWHRCKRFEDAVADPITFRLLRLAVERGRARDARQQ